MLEIANLEVVYNEVILVLRGLSIEVPDGQIVALLGGNGAGKTTTTRAITGLLDIQDGKITKGSVTFNGQEIHDNEASSIVRGGISQVYRPQEGDIRWKGESIMGQRPDAVAALGVARTFQNIELFPHMTVIENLLLGRHIRMERSWLAGALWFGPAKKEEMEHRLAVENIIDFLEIEQWRKHPVALLPYGFQKRVELGRALAMDPELLLLDEPVAGMNLEETEDMARFIMDIRQELGIAMILVEHDMGLVMDIADRLMVLDFGQKISEGTPEVVQKDPAVIAAYLGDEEGLAAATSD